MLTIDIDSFCLAQFNIFRYDCGNCRSNFLYIQGGAKIKAGQYLSPD